MHNGSSKEPDYRILFDSIPGLYLVLSPASGFPIVAVSSGLLQATATRREDLVGHSLLDAFADNVRESGASFELCEYDTNGHLFTDEELVAEYDAQAMHTLESNALRFLAGLNLGR